MSGLHVSLLLAGILAGFVGATGMLVLQRMLRVENPSFLSKWGERLASVYMLAVWFSVVFLAGIAILAGTSDQLILVGGSGVVFGILEALYVRQAAARRIFVVKERLFFDVFPDDFPSEQQGPQVPEVAL
jgi:hypothetical protein